ncbi:threonine synthase [Terrimonas rubra]|uniref:Threonine synthase n=1 Tax=Terrimonas rubra TaxID=1035890 RepID=A0ABW6A7H8_9BACT
MKYYSTNKQSPAVDFKQAAIAGQAPDKGLYFPEKLPAVSPHLIRDIELLSNESIACEVIKPYVGDVIPADILQQIVADTVNFPLPMVPVTNTISSLELFHGPTLAFKDIGARFMSRCLGYFLKDETKKVTVLVATSGDTGGAVANGFYGVEGVEVVILYPSGKVSPVQEKQLTGLGGNIHALEVNGSFDDCQQLVKEAFADEDLRSKVFLTSANSINVARWLPQQFYYFLAWKQWADKNNPPVVAVPSGNFGNICAGILARQTGLPIKHFIAACNINDVVSPYLQTGNWQTKKAVATLSNAMDVANPSNFVRILEIFNREFSTLSNSLSSATVTDAETEATIKTVYQQTGYLLDPHGAVGYLALEQYLAQHGGKGIFLETAHPVKFPEAVERITGKPVAIPEAVQTIMDAPKKSELMEVAYEKLRAFLLQ